MLKLKQWGHNPNFPEIAETWRFGEKVPEWLSDQAKIAGFDSTGGLLLETYTDQGTGKIHIKDTYRPTDLIVLDSKDHFVIYGKGFPLKVLSPEQIDMIYYEI